MPWKEVSMEDQRLKFVLEASDKHSPLTFGQLCEKYNISRKTGYKWFDRFHDYGKLGLKELPRTPRTHPTKILLDVEQMIVSIRNEYPTYGPKKIRAVLENEYSYVKTPSEAAIGNILKQRRLSRPRNYRRHVARTAPLSGCHQPNDVWMYDFKGYFHTKNGAKCEPLTITDGYSRYLLGCFHMERKREEDVWKEIEKVFYEYGLPSRIRSDNGPPFATTSVGRLSRLAVKLIKIGITPEWIEPGCPEQNGRHERFHLTLKNETATPPALTLPLQLQKFEQFQHHYNYRRPHEALGQKTPASVYKPSARVWDGKFRKPEYSGEFQTRKVESGGHITWKGLKLFISEILQGDYIGVKETDMGIMGVYYGPILLGHIDLSKGFKRR